MTLTVPLHLRSTSYRFRRGPWHDSFHEFGTSRHAELLWTLRFALLALEREWSPSELSLLIRTDSPIVAKWARVCSGQMRDKGHGKRTSAGMSAAVAALKQVLGGFAQVEVELNKGAVVVS